MIALNGTRHSDSVYPYLKTGIEHSALYSFSFVDLSKTATCLKPWVNLPIPLIL